MPKSQGMIGADDLRVFLETASTGNMTRAAERIGLSQSALSHAIKRMESELGSTLFQRSKTGLKLTRAGEKLRSRGEHLVREWESLHRSLREDEEMISGQIRLGCHPSVAMYAIPMFLPELQRQYPLVDLQLAHGLSRHIAEDLISQRLDMGLVINPPAHPDLVLKEILKDEVGFWTVAKKKTPEVLIWDPQLLQSQWLVRELEKKKIFYPRRIETSSLEVVRELAAQGCGVGLLPGRVAGISAELTRVHREVPPYRDRLCLVYRADLEKTAAVRAVLSVIRSA